MHRPLPLAGLLLLLSSPGKVVAPTSARGKRRVKAETEWMATGLPTMVFRLPGKARGPALIQPESLGRISLNDCLLRARQELVIVAATP